MDAHLDDGLEACAVLRDQAISAQRAEAPMSPKSKAIRLLPPPCSALSVGMRRACAWVNRFPTFSSVRRLSMKLHHRGDGEAVDLGKAHAA
jgi:hypothetical protein